MQIDLDDVRALGDSVDRMLADYPSRVASLQTLKEPDVHRTKAERKLAELGVGFVFNPVIGGGLDLRAQAVLAERYGRHLFQGASLFQDVIGGYVVSQLSSLPDSLTTESFARTGWSLTVPLPGDPVEQDVKARPDGDGWMLDGTLSAVPYMNESTHVLVRAVDETGKVLHAMVPADAPGVQAYHQHGVDGVSLSLAKLVRVKVAPDAIVGGVEIENIVAQGQRHATLLLCFEAVGLMEQLLNKTTEYLQVRKQFGKPIGSFQALQHRMVDVLLLLEQTRSAARLALRAMVSGAVDQQMRLSAAKYAVGVNGRKVAEECIQLHGGIGMTWELDVAHYAKRLVMLDHYFDDADQSLTQVMAGL